MTKIHRSSLILLWPDFLTCHFPPKHRTEILPAVSSGWEAECVCPPGDLIPSQLLSSCSLLSLHTEIFVTIYALTPERPTPCIFRLVIIKLPKGDALHLFSYISYKFFRKQHPIFPLRGFQT